MKIKPHHAEAHYNLGIVLAVQGKIDESLAHYSKAVQLNQNIDTSPNLHRLLAINYAAAHRFHEAISSAERALALAHNTGKGSLIEEIEEMIRLYRQTALKEK